MVVCWRVIAAICPGPCGSEEEPPFGPGKYTLPFWKRNNRPGKRSAPGFRALLWIAPRVVRLPLVAGESISLTAPGMVSDSRFTNRRELRLASRKNYRPAP